MLFNSNVTLGDLGLIAVFIVIVVAGIFMIRALVHLGGALKTVKKLMSDNAEGIDKVIKDMPALTENAVNITEIAVDVADNLRNEQELIESTLESVSDTIESVSDTARAINEDLLGGVRRLSKAIVTVVGFITKKKPAESADGANGADSSIDTGGMKTGGAGGADGGASGGEALSAAKNGVKREARREKRERKAGKARVRSAAVAARKRRGDRGANINIHIR